MGLSALNPVAQVMVKQMLFLDPPSHTRIRGLASAAFTPTRVEALRSHIREIVKNLLRPFARGTDECDSRSGRAVAVHRDRRNARCAGGGPSAIEIVVAGFRRDAWAIFSTTPIACNASSNARKTCRAYFRSAMRDNVCGPKAWSTR